MSGISFKPGVGMVGGARSPRDFAGLRPVGGLDRRAAFDLGALAKTTDSAITANSANPQALDAMDRTRREARDAATQLVASAFVLPVLQTLRESPLAPQSGPFASNVADKRFGPLLDEKMADSITKGANFKLIDAIVNMFMQNDKAPTNIASA